MCSPHVANQTKGEESMNYILTILSAILFLSPPVFGGENCSQLGGTCQNACRQGEQAESGAFEDCGETQECCVSHDASRDRIRCCIASFEAQQFSPRNCVLPQNNLCSAGSGSPVACENLTFCKERK
jgi:hypothetical protein